MGAKYAPTSHGPCSKSLKHLVDFGSWAVPGGQRHSAIPPPAGLSSIVSGHGYPSC